MSITAEQIISEMVTTCPTGFQKDRKNQQRDRYFSQMEFSNEFILGIAEGKFHGLYLGFHQYKASLKKELKAVASQKRVEMDTFFMGWPFYTSEIESLREVCQELAAHYQIPFDIDKQLQQIDLSVTHVIYVVLTCITSDTGLLDQGGIQ